MLSGTIVQWYKSPGDSVTEGDVLVRIETEDSFIETRVRVPDQGTVLLGGLTMTAQVEKEMGVPILSKIPITIGWDRFSGS